MFFMTGLTTEEIQQCFWRGIQFIYLPFVLYDCKCEIQCFISKSAIYLQESWWQNSFFEISVGIVKS
jgi:hypothetical protein